MYSEEIFSALEGFLNDEEIIYFAKDNIFHFALGDIGKLHMSVPVRIIVRDDSYLFLAEFPLRAGRSVSSALAGHICGLNYALLQGRWEYHPAEEGEEAEPIRFCVYVPCLNAGLGYMAEKHFF